MSSSFGRFGAVLLVAFATTGIAAAQETINQATISGRVLDPQGAAVPGALVSVRQTDTNVTVEADDGRRGTLPLSVSEDRPVRAAGCALQGFKEHARTLMLSAGSAFDLPITLDVGRHRRRRHGRRRHPGARDRAQPDRRHGAAGGGPEPADERPQLPRPRAARPRGVAHQHQQHAAVRRDVRRSRARGISIASQRNLSNSFIVDGLSANDDAAGLSGIPFGVDAIEQFQVVTGGGQAELGRALGGYVNVVTRSGTNALHGTVYGFFRDDAFNGKNALTGTTLPMDQQQFGGSVGGPLVRNRTFYFTNVERKLLDQTGVVSITPDERRRRSTPGWHRSATRGSRSTPASIPIPCTA